jgi:lysyl-tRNA synthetase class 2
MLGDLSDKVVADIGAGSGKNFRNEGVSSQHLQEFSVVEWYAAYKNYYYNIGLTAQLLYHLGINEVAEIYSYDDLFVKYTGFTAVSFPDPDTEYKKKIRPYLQNLTLIYDYPASMMPLAHCRGNIAEAFQFVWKGSEIVKGYTEQTDYNAQLEAFRNQGSSLDGEMVIEEDFLEAMKYGMPPMSGVGIGIDRIVMLKHNLSSIKDAVFFSL